MRAMRAGPAGRTQSAVAGQGRGRTICAEAAKANSEVSEASARVRMKHLRNGGYHGDAAMRPDLHTSFTIGLVIAPARG